MIMKSGARVITIGQAKPGRGIMQTRWGVSALLVFCGRWRSRSLLVTGFDLFEEGRGGEGVGRWCLVHAVFFFHGAVFLFLIPCTN